MQELLDNICEGMYENKNQDKEDLTCYNIGALKTFSIVYLLSNDNK